MTTESKSGRHAGRAGWLRVASVLALGLGAVGCWGPPQIGVDHESFQAVDALYTAVSLRDPVLVGRCREKLRGLREANKLPGPAAIDLEAIIEEARGGGWEPAQVRLGRFMEGQRR